MSNNSNCACDCYCLACIKTKMDAAFDAPDYYREFRFGGSESFARLKQWPKINRRPLEVSAVMAFDSFPKCVARYANGYLWYLPQVERWLDEHKMEIDYAIRYSKVKGGSFNHMWEHLKHPDELVRSQELEEDEEDIKF